MSITGSHKKALYKFKVFFNIAESSDFVTIMAGLKAALVFLPQELTLIS